MLSFFIGATGGLLAASQRGIVDSILSRTVDLLLAFPPLIFALVILSVLPSSTPILILVMAFLDFYSRLSRQLFVGTVGNNGGFLRSGKTAPRKKPAIFCGVRFCPMFCRRYWRNLACALVL